MAEITLLGAEGRLLKLVQKAEAMLKALKQADPQVRTDERDNMMAAHDALWQELSSARAFLRIGKH